jgi:hypothetical protein
MRRHSFDVSGAEFPSLTHPAATTSAPNKGDLEPARPHPGSADHAPSMQTARGSLSVSAAAFHLSPADSSNVQSPYAQLHIQELVEEATELALMYRFAEEPCYPRFEAMPQSSPETLVECVQCQRLGLRRCACTNSAEPRNDWPEVDEFLGASPQTVADMISSVRRFHSF